MKDEEAKSIGLSQAQIKAQAAELHKQQFMKGEFQNIRMQESYWEFYEHKNKEAQAAQSMTAAQTQ